MSPALKPQFESPEVVHDVESHVNLHIFLVVSHTGFDAPYRLVHEVLVPSDLSLERHSLIVYEL